jgi:hypothetical protein
VSAHLQDFHIAMMAPGAPIAPDEIGVLLADCVKTACAKAGLEEVEIYQGGPIVTMLLSPTKAWEAVIVGPNAYQFYPGMVRENEIHWINVWVGATYDVEMFVAAVEGEIEAARIEGIRQ